MNWEMNVTKPITFLFQIVFIEEPTKQLRIFNQGLNILHHASHLFWCNDIQHNNIKHNDTQHNDTKHNNT